MDFSPDYGVGWREKIMADLSSYGITWLNPCNKPTVHAPEGPDTYAKLRDAKERGDYDYVHDIMQPIRCIDLRLVDVADFLIVHIDLRVPMLGTVEEITTANRSKKPILVHVEQGKASISNWLFAMLPHSMIFSTWDELYRYLEDVNAGIRTDKRWIFFNLE
jgi:hypothetical protein